MEAPRPHCMWECSGEKRTQATAAVLGGRERDDSQSEAGCAGCVCVWEGEKEVVSRARASHLGGAVGEVLQGAPQLARGGVQVLGREDLGVGEPGGTQDVAPTQGLRMWWVGTGGAVGRTGDVQGAQVGRGPRAFPTPMPTTTVPHRPFPLQTHVPPPPWHTQRTHGWQWTRPRRSSAAARSTGPQR
jgi:hypothetical protein